VRGGGLIGEQTQVIEGKLVCGNCGHEYAIHQGIANFLLPGHLGISLAPSVCLGDAVADMCNTYLCSVRINK